MMTFLILLTTTAVSINCEQTYRVQTLNPRNIFRENTRYTLYRNSLEDNYIFFQKDCPGPLTCRINLGRLEYLNYLLNTTRNLRNEILETIEEEANIEPSVTPVISYKKFITKINEANKARSKAPYSAASIHHKTMGT